MDKRQIKQEQRIDQGVASGQLTAAETAKLERQEAKIDAREQAAKADGVVTKAERANYTQPRSKGVQRFIAKNIMLALLSNP